ncbi:MAG: hypothetical protein WD554_04945 [Flavobacteriaceae bacterium]
MNKKARIFLYILAGIIVLFVIAVFVANPIIENKIKETIAQEVPDEFQINKYEISANSFRGAITIKDLQITVKDTLADFTDADISLTKASFNGLSYWKYLFSGKIDFNSIILHDLNMKTYRDTTKNNSLKKKQKEFEENISTGKFTLENASFLLKNTDESIALQLDSLNFSITNVEVNKRTLQEKIPFYFSEMEVDTQDFFYELNENETLSLKEFAVLDQQLKITDFAIKTKSDTLKPSPDSANEIGRKDIKIPSLTLSDLHFKVVDDTFQLFGEDLEVENPSIWLQQGINGNPEKNKGLQKETKEIPLPFSIASISVNNAQIDLLHPDESPYLQVEDFNMTLKDVLANNTTLQQKIPCEFSDVEFEGKSLQYRMNAYDLLSLTHVSLDEKQLQIKDLHIKTQYSKTELSKVLEKERDHMDAEMPSLVIEGFGVTSKDSIIHVQGSSTTIKDPTLNVYRDKLVADDPSIKPLYSKSLRELPFALTLDSLFIKNGGIVYEEKVKSGQPPGKVYFSDLNAAIGNMSNTYAKGEKETTIDITTTFMENSPLEVDWHFDINNTDDQFQFTGHLGSIEAKHLNSFAKASLNVNLEGTLRQTYFNIHGNNNDSRIDMRLEFDNFKIEVLDKKDKKNWLFSAVANIFVKRDSDSNKNDFKEGDATATRNKDKSYFNYIWISIQAGLKEILIAT